MKPSIPDISIFFKVDFKHFHSNDDQINQVDLILLRFGSISDTKVLLLPTCRQRVTESNPCRLSVVFLTFWSLQSA